ncbi:MAG: GGDEF and EAL domain-containing protein [Erysipelotrichaceae bacterium]
MNNKHDNKINNSMVKRLLKPMLIVLVAQLVIFLGSLYFTNTFSKLNSNAVEVLNQKSANRADYLKTAMKSGWSDVQEPYAKLSNSINELIEGGKRNTDILKGSEQQLIEVLRRSDADGAYIMLETQEEDSVLYFKDEDTLINSKDNSDILLSIGPSSVKNDLRISMSENYVDEPTYVVENLSFKDTVDINITTQNLAPKEYGYWGKPIFKNNQDEIAMSYIQPILNEKKEVIAYVGIEVANDTLASFLNNDKLKEDDSTSYVLANKPKDRLTYSSIYAPKNDINDHITLNKIKLEKDISTKDISVLVEDNEIYGSLNTIKLYNSNTPFDTTDWALITLTKKSTLFSASNDVLHSFILSLVTSFILAIIGIIIVGVRFLDPFKKLVSKVQNIDPFKPVHLDKYGIIEIDELSDAVETLSYKLSDSASKFSQIIELVSLPIGAFEYQDDDDTVFVSSKFFEVLQIKQNDISPQYISRDLFKKYMNRLSKTNKIDEPNLYCIRLSEDKYRWIEMKSEYHDNKLIGVVSDVSEEILEKQKLEYERDHDLLTMLLNRRAFYTQVNTIMNSDEVKIAAFIMWDLDNLKYINDNYGHDFGDQYLKLMAKVLRKFNLYNSVVSRISGDEFYVFIYGYNNQNEIRKVIDKIKKEMAVTSLILPNGKEFIIRASGGISWYPTDSRKYDELMKFADFAMYKVKHTQKGNLEEFNKEVYIKESYLIDSKEELNVLFDEELVSFAFQPIVDAHTGNILAYEALMRPDSHSFVNPTQLIAMATSQHKLYQVERLTMRKALATYTAKQSEFNNAKLFINSIPNYVLNDLDINELDEAYHDILCNVIFEIIENEQLNENCMNIKIEHLNKWNSTFAIDDYGSGYNNESILLNLNPSYIKIDMEIIRNIHMDVKRQDLFRNLLSYAHSRDIKVIGEGVETLEEMTYLIKNGIDLLQGFYLGYPKLDPEGISKVVINQILEINK